MHYLETRQIIPISLDKAWEFFSNPENLSLITPPDMGFKIINQSGSEMYPGMIISYKVRPLLGIPVTWVTEITHAKEKYYFVDEQRIGPYRLWHHQHHFRQVEEGVEMWDRVDYALPLWGIGKILNRLLVRNKLANIFKFRETRINEMFG